MCNPYKRDKEVSRVCRISDAKVFEPLQNTRTPGIPTSKSQVIRKGYMQKDLLQGLQENPAHFTKTTTKRQLAPNIRKLAVPCYTINTKMTS